MKPNRFLFNLGGWCILLSGLLYVVITIYIFGVLSQNGFNSDMFDDHALLQPWVAAHTRSYQFVWIFYFLTQLFLLPMPLILSHYLANELELASGLVQLGRLLGTTAVALALLSPIIFYAITPTTAQAYIAPEFSSESQSLVLVITTLLSDISKEVRLFSEVILGIWLAITGYLFVNIAQSQRLGWFTAGVGGWTLLVAILKILNPQNPLEDFLGLLLAITYISIGVYLLRLPGKQEVDKTLEKTHTKTHSPIQYSLD